MHVSTTEVSGSELMNRAVVDVGLAIAKLTVRCAAFVEKALAPNEESMLRNKKRERARGRWLLVVDSLMEETLLSNDFEVYYFFMFVVVASSFDVQDWIGLAAIRPLPALVKITGTRRRTRNLAVQSVDNSNKKISR